MKNPNTAQLKNLSLLGGALLALAASPSANAALVAFYDFEDNVLDSSGNGNNGTPNGTGIGYSTSVAATIDGRSDKSLNLTGDPGLDFVSIPTGFNSLANSGGASISLWVQTAAVVDQDYVFAVGNSGSTTPFYGLQGGVGGTSTMRFFYRNDASTSDSATGTANVFNNGWQHLVLTHDGTDVKVYVNGSSTADISLTLPSGALTVDTESLGVIDRSSNFGYIAGQIDEVAVYDSVLNASQISSLFGGAAPSTIPEPSSLALLGLAGLLPLLRRRRK